MDASPAVKIKFQRSNTMKSSTKDEAKGKTKEVAGKQSDNPKLKTEGIETVALPVGIVMEHILSPLWFDDFN